ncbi:lipocalin-like domain-containing protein [Halomonas sp. M20]|uniref:lipocalin-like domain-containing protein n=1 Tax=Halomonas sp. M20 TaxID=2763264 RepID=UPI001D0A01B4|nr:lipocalin-like domain-containing protein [Halomonas sp. M20]
MTTITTEALNGSWALVHFVYRWPDGRELAPLGQASGQLLYLLEDDAPGRMAVQVVASERPSLDPDSEASLAAHFRSGFAYGGRWSLHKGMVHHQVEIASIPSWEGSQLARRIQLVDDRLILSTDEPSPQLPQGGYETVLEWQR